MAYHRFTDDQGNAYGSFEVFFYRSPINVDRTMYDSEGNALASGWYWQACFPGCMPDSDFPSGPFGSEDEAIRDAKEEG